MTDRQKLKITDIESIPGWLSRHEILFLYQAARCLGGAGEVMEIGSWKGKSTVALGLGIRDSGLKRHLFAVDPHQGIIRNSGIRQPGGTYREFRDNIRKTGLDRLVRPLKMTSASAVRGWSRPISMLFIDGLHDYLHASEDLRLWRQYVTTGGIIAFHDGFAGTGGVMRAIDEGFLNPDNLTDIGTVSSILYGVVGKPGYWARQAVSLKIRLIRLANRLYRNRTIPDPVKYLIIHRLIRFMLLNRHTLRVYIPFI